MKRLSSQGEDSVRNQVFDNRDLSAEVEANDRRMRRRPKGVMFLNAAFLLRKNKISKFKTAFQQIQKEYSRKGIEFRMSGPWPPYNFSN
jgi:hypothetical protein